MRLAIRIDLISFLNAFSVFPDLTQTERRLRGWRLTRRADLLRHGMQRSMEGYGRIEESVVLWGAG